MPLVQITLARGRTPEQLAALGEAVTAAVARAVGAPRGQRAGRRHRVRARALVRRRRVAGRAAGVREAMRPCRVSLVRVDGPGVVDERRRPALRRVRAARRRCGWSTRVCPHNGGPLEQGWVRDGTHARLPVALVPLRPRHRGVRDLAPAPCSASTRSARSTGGVYADVGEPPRAAVLVGAAARARPGVRCRPGTSALGQDRRTARDSPGTVDGTGSGRGATGMLPRVSSPFGGSGDPRPAPQSILGSQPTAVRARRPTRRRRAVRAAAAGPVRPVRARSRTTAGRPAPVPAELRPAAGYGQQGYGQHGAMASPATGSRGTASPGTDSRATASRATASRATGSPTASRGTGSPATATGRRPEEEQGPALDPRRVALLLVVVIAVVLVIALGGGGTVTGSSRAHRRRSRTPAPPVSPTPSSSTAPARSRRSRWRVAITHPYTCDLVVTLRSPQGPSTALADSQRLHAAQPEPQPAARQPPAREPAGAAGRAVGLRALDARGRRRHRHRPRQPDQLEHHRRDVSRACSGSRSVLRLVPDRRRRRSW